MSTARAELRTIRQSVPALVSFPFEQTGEARCFASGVVTDVETYEGDVVGRGRELLVVDGRPVVAVNAAAPFPRELRARDTGDDVAVLQAALAEEGYYRGVVSGEFDEATFLALKAWQRVHKLPATGVFEPRDVLVGTWPSRVHEVRVRAGDRVEAGQAVLVLSESVVRVGTLELANRSDDGRVLDGMRVEWPGGGGTVERSEDALFVRFEAGGGYTSEATALEAVIVLRERENVLSVPVEAVLRDGDQAYVRVRDGDHERRVAVQPGVSDGTYTQVTGDLRVGDQVVVGSED
ncbi:MAG: peptidoglycan-binding protein [Tepidiformaceae bacterium]